MMWVPDSFWQLASIFTASDSRFCVAYSGGLDSRVLLNVMHEWVAQHPGQQLRAVHVHHGWHARADDWERHCLDVCQTEHIPLTVHHLNLMISPGDSMEAVARTARYQALGEGLQPGEYLLTAHTQEDQMETLLLQLFRGAGVKGLAAMPMQKTWAEGFLLRPFLNISRAALQQYAQQRQLQWIEDDSNFSLRFNRNFLRHRVIPILKERWPDVASVASRSARHCAEVAEWLASVADEDLRIVQGEASHTLRITPLLSLPLLRQRNVVRYWIDAQRHRMPTEKQLKYIFENIIAATQDANPCLALGSMELRRFRDRLFLLSAIIPHNADQTIAWDWRHPLTLPSNLGQLTARRVQGCGVLLPQEDCFHVRFRGKGERCRPAGRRHSQLLKKLFQEWGVPPWQRDRIPLIYHGEALVAVMGYCIHADYAVNADDWGVELLWTP